MDELTTGQVAHSAGLSEKAVRMYADRGLLDARRGAADGRRLFGVDQVERARWVRLLRGVDLTLAEVEDVLDGSDRVARFDEIWTERRSGAAQAARAGEYVRSALAGPPRLDVAVLTRDVPERLVLRTGRRARLAELASVLPEATDALFDVLRATSSTLAGSPFVEYHERATEGFAARISVCAPVADVLRPPAGLVLATDPAHAERYVELDQETAGDQTFLVLVHDYLSSGSGVAEVVGDNREVYLPAWGAGELGPVMEVAVPVARQVP
ncbi:MerR family transcriptional regulator [Xylanimonas allomyrinae]|nr:MerR family transcriptional regulator [Xylanimonas allomyrinae]